MQTGRARRPVPGWLVLPVDDSGLVYSSSAIVKPEVPSDWISESLHR